MTVYYKRVANERRKRKIAFSIVMLVQQNYGGWLQNMTVFSKDVRHEIKNIAFWICNVGGKEYAKWKA